MMCQNDLFCNSFLDFKMPQATQEYKVQITKTFWKYLSSERLKPSTKAELRQLYYEKFKKTLDSSSPTVSFSTVMYYLKRRKKLVKCKDGSDNLLYFERKGRRLVLAVDQSFVQRKQKSTAASSKEKVDDEKEVDETERETKADKAVNTVQDLKKLFVKDKWVNYMQSIVELRKFNFKNAKMPQG